MNKIILFILLFIVGCNHQTEYVRDRYTSLVSCYSYYVVKTKAVDNDVKFKRSECPHCKGTGKLKSGDGILIQECPYCESDKSYIGELQKDKCCEDCICDECDCSYPGECIIKKNNGWPVEICDDISCRTYYPKDENGNKYNPYDFLTEKQKKSKEFIQYKNPIKVKIEDLYN